MGGGILQKHNTHTQTNKHYMRSITPSPVLWEDREM
jgi:hypothetical protein